MNKVFISRARKVKRYFVRSKDKISYDYKQEGVNENNSCKYKCR